MRYLITLSVILNLALGYSLWRTSNDYSNLLTWACESASLGGYECGEQ